MGKVEERRLPTAPATPGPRKAKPKKKKRDNGKKKAKRMAAAALSAEASAAAAALSYAVPLPIPCVYYDPAFLSRAEADAYYDLFSGSAIQWASSAVSRRPTALYGNPTVQYHGPRRADSLNLPAVGYASDEMHPWTTELLELKAPPPRPALSATAPILRPERLASAPLPAAHTPPPHTSAAHLRRRPRRRRGTCTAPTPSTTCTRARTCEAAPPRC